MRKSEWRRLINSDFSAVFGDENRIQIFLSLLGQGYFARQLPPPFSTATFAAAVGESPRDFRNTIADHIFKRQARLYTYSLARPGQLRRLLGIPNPAFHFLVSLKLAHLFEDFEAEHQGATIDISLGFPKFQTDRRTRAFELSTDWDEMPARRLRARSRGKYLIKADIARFFPSIYTHSIAWALHGKETAKSNRFDYSLDGNLLDLYVRNAQDGQTLGIPIGPDTSFLISEKILLGIDASIRRRLTERNISYFHRVDDYEFVCTSRQEADLCLAVLQEVLKEYELELNTLKTQVFPLPQDIQETEVALLRNFDMNDRPIRRELLQYYDLAFDAYRRHPKGTLKYAIKRIPTEDFFDETIIDFMMQCMLLEPGTTEAVFIWLAKAERIRNIDGTALSACLSRIILEHSVLGHTSEVAWAMWGFLLLQEPIPDDVTRAILKMNDSVVLLLALDARKKRLLSSRNLTSHVRNNMTGPNLYGQQWLLSYEAAHQSWVPRASRAHVNEDPFFSLLNEKNVTFYETQDIEDYQETMKDWEPYHPYLPDDEDELGEEDDWDFDEY